MLEVQTSQQENKETLFPINMYLLPGENIKDGARWWKKYQEADNKLKNPYFLKETILKALNDSHWDVKQEAVRLSENINDEGFKKEIILKALNDSDSIVRREAVRLSENINDEEVRSKVKETILKDLNDSYWSVRRGGVRLSENINDEGFKKEIILKALNDSEWGVRQEAVRLSENINDEEVRSEVKETILKALNDSDWGVRQEAIRLSKNINDEEVISKVKETILKALNDSDWDVRQVAIRLSENINDEEVRSKVKETTENHFREYNLSSDLNLYDKSKGNKSFGNKLDKTGSETILLDKIPGMLEKSFRGKIIMRIIKFSSFLAWKKAYEDHEAWRKAGFDYVPVEPILYFSLQDDMTVRVYTSVLDQNIKFLSLENDMRLKETLKEIKIYHGHLHDRNICSYFKRDNKGNRIIDKMPRQYIIDFDQAEILK